MEQRKQNTEIERRAIPTPVAVEIRAEGESSVRTIKGMAAVFNQRTELWSGIFEEIAKGAFDEALKNADCRCLFNHNPSEILGRTKSGTLKLTSDDNGLSYECELPQSPIGETVGAAIERGDVSQSSFGFTIAKHSWTDLGDGTYLRTIEQVGELYDVSPVTYPAYQDTDVSIARSQFNDWQKPKPDPSRLKNRERYYGGTQAEVPNENHISTTSNNK